MSIISSGIKAVVTTFGEEATLALQRFRKSICMGCPSMKNISGSDPSCGIPGIKTRKTCGCFINPKTALVNEHCPQGKW